MKKNIIYFSVLLVSVITGAECFSQITLPNVITTTFVCTNTNVYLIDGKVYVKDGGKIEIQEGTVIKGVRKATPDQSSALIITRSGTIDCQGTNVNPVVFTSNEASPSIGDWGGIVLLGSAPLNRADTTIEGIDLPSLPAGVDVGYGGGGQGLGDTLNSKGVIRYTRIEYAGAKVTADNELNGLTCGGCGRGTELDFIQVLYGQDDAFEWFGGNVNAKHLIALAPDDDSWDSDFGFNGNLQFVVSVLSRTKALYSADPNGIESDNNQNGTTLAPRTNMRVSNMTTIGLADSLVASEFLPAPGSKRILNGARFRRASSLTVRNSIFMGFPVGVRFESAATQADVGRFTNNIVHGFRQVSRDATIDASNTGYLGNVLNANAQVRLTDPFNPTLPDFRPDALSAAISGANFTGMTGLTATGSEFFQTVTYRGAFSPTTNWAATWARFF
ncbi:MAG: hypothetical protein H7Y42_12430 [Chitinophagaceae bacterium]|nr:hypothetical protein [Chitinophagaceae bacterium]